MHRLTGRLTVCMVVFLTVFLSRTQALAVTAEEEAERVEQLSAMEPTQREEIAVQPLIEIEKTWEIEDTHTAAASQLVTSVSFCRGETGHDRESHTFYASLGTGLTQWPELEMTASGAEGLRVAWVDDYAWDDPKDAVRQGTAYQLIAWTDTEYEYLKVIFTGLPVMSIRTYAETEPSDSYEPAYVSLASADFDAVSSIARIHTRGGGYKVLAKQSYRIEFAGKKKQKYGYKKKKVSLLGMPEDTDWVLLANGTDETHLRNMVGFRLWKGMNADTTAFGLLEGCLVEVCLNDEYLGIYNLQQRVKPVRELEQAGCSAADVSVRVVKTYSIEDRPAKDTSGFLNGGWLELRYQPQGKTVEECFALYDDYLKLWDSGTDSETFISLAEEHLDIGALMRYFVYFQAAVLNTDNIGNNTYIWAVRKGGKLLYYLSPWDLDNAFSTEDLEEKELNEKMKMPIRVLDLDVPGAREALWKEWNRLRSGLLSDESIAGYAEMLQEEMNSTGAWRRDAEKWDTENGELDLTVEQNDLTEHLKRMEQAMLLRWPQEEAEGTESR